MTHAELVDRADAWLRSKSSSGHRCLVVLTEHTGSREQPDAIGWRAHGSTVLVECKATRSDLLRDKLKPWRRMTDKLAHGRERWYLINPEVLDVRLPLACIPSEWGVAIAGHRIKIVRAARPDPAWTADRDACFLVRELQRFQLQGMKPLTWANFQRKKRGMAPIGPRSTTQYVETRESFERDRMGETGDNLREK